MDEGGSATICVGEGEGASLALAGSRYIDDGSSASKECVGKVETVLGASPGLMDGGSHSSGVSLLDELAIGG